MYRTVPINFFCSLGTNSFYYYVSKVKMKHGHVAERQHGHAVMQHTSN